MNLAKSIEHTHLKADARQVAIEALCEEVIAHGLGGACVPPYFVPFAVQRLEEHPAFVTTVIGYPMGYSATAAKVEEIKRALGEGCDEVDVVANLCALKDGRWAFFRNDIDSVTRAGHLKGKAVKIILEVGLLTEEELQSACEICAELEVDFVKTSTGMLSDGATGAQVRQLRQWLPKRIKIKASGGIRTHLQAVELVKAGADRLGSSAGPGLLEE